MKPNKPFVRLLSILHIVLQFTYVSNFKTNCIVKNEGRKHQELAKDLLTEIVPSLDELNAGKGGKIGVIGGSIEHTGSTYLSAISALRVGADLVYVLTTERVAPVLRCFSPDLMIFAYLHDNFMYKIASFIRKMDLLIIGPGLGRENSTVNLIIKIIKSCKRINKPLLISGNGLYALSKNVTIIKNYPSPGVILSANHFEASNLIKSITIISRTSNNWYDFWGGNVSVLINSKDDHFISSYRVCSWVSLHTSSGRRRLGNHGDIISGFLGTLFNWAIKSNYCDKLHKTQLAQSISSYGAIQLTQMCNYYAYLKFGRNMITSDMLSEIHASFNQVFTK